MNILEQLNKGLEEKYSLKEDKELKTLIHKAWNDLPDILYKLHINENGVFTYTKKDGGNPQELDINIYPILANIQVNNIATLQNKISQEVLDYYLNNDVCDPITVIKYSDTYLLMDGNHRVNAAIMQNKKIIKAKIYNYLTMKNDLERALIKLKH